MIIRAIAIVLVWCSTLFAGQGMGPGPGIYALPASIDLVGNTASKAYVIPTELSSSSRIVGQSFSVASVGTARKIVIYGRADGPSNITIRIGLSLDMSSSYLGSGSLYYPGGSDGEITINLANGVLLQPGTTYYLGVISDSTYATRVILRGSNTSAYANGGLATSASGWPMTMAGSTLDLYFRVSS